MKLLSFKKILVCSLLCLLTLTFVGCDKTCKEHIAGEWEIVTAATCTESGLKQKKCTKCSEILETVAISVLEHTAISMEEVSPTCTEDGKEGGKKCSICGEILEEQNIVKALGHSYALDTNASTDTTLVYKCSRCNDEYTIENTGGCTDGHTESNWQIVKEATCTEKGLRKIVCTKCGIIIKSEEIAMVDHTVEILAGKAATCTENGLTEGKKCSVCGEILIAQTEITTSGHNYELQSTKAPTEAEEGYLEYKCSICGDIYQEILEKVTDYDETKETIITLADKGSIVTNNNGGVIISDSTIKIILAGEYSITGTLSEGSIVVALGESDKAVINLQGMSVSSSQTNPFYVESGDEVEISAKSKTENYIYDNREFNQDASGAALQSDIDLELKGKGLLKIETNYNNGVASKKDLKIKNLTLDVKAINNAIKGKDSLTIESGKITAVSTQGDALKTEDSDISSKGNQRGIITINDGLIDLYAACDAIDASYDVVINGGTINIYTDKYSEYSEEIVTTSENIMYIRLSSKLSRESYTFSIKFYDSNNKETLVNGKVMTEGNTKYYKFEVPVDSKKLKVYVYKSNQVQGSDEYYICSDIQTLPTSQDVFYISQIITNTTLSGSWTNYQSTPTGGFGPGGGFGHGGGFGGDFGGDGNSDKAEYSCKGIKADNAILINAGDITIKSHDDGIHANNDNQLETLEYGKGEITINGGNITIYCDDDGIHGDGNVVIAGGNIIVTKSYEGVEGNVIIFNGGTTQVKASDDGVNAKSSLVINDGILFIDADGDGIDSNNTVTMTGGVVLATGPENGGNGVIDFDRSFTFSGGLLLAIGCSGMNQRPTAASGNTSNSSTISTNTSSYVNVTINNEVIATIKVTKSRQNYCVLAYNNTDYAGAKVTITTSNSNELVNGLYYIK